jgi:hypothetical protein
MAEFALRSASSYVISIWSTWSRSASRGRSVTCRLVSPGRHVDVGGVRDVGYVGMESGVARLFEKI